MKLSNEAILNELLIQSQQAMNDVPIYTKRFLDIQTNDKISKNKKQKLAKMYQELLSLTQPKDMMNALERFKGEIDKLSGIKPLRPTKKTKADKIIDITRAVAETHTVNKEDYEIMKSKNTDKPIKRIGSFMDDILIEDMILELISSGVKYEAPEGLSYGYFKIKDIIHEALDGAGGTQVEIWHGFKELVAKYKKEELNPPLAVVKYYDKYGTKCKILARPYNIQAYKEEALPDGTKVQSLEIGFLKLLYTPCEEAIHNSWLRIPNKPTLKIYEAFKDLYGDADGRIIHSLRQTFFYILTHIHEPTGDDTDKDIIKTTIDLKDYAKCCHYDNWNLKQDNFKYSYKDSLALLNKACAVFNNLGKTGRLEGDFMKNKNDRISTCPIGVEKADYDPIHQQVKLTIRRRFIKEQIADYDPISPEFL